jgi:aspartate ammonia-lyase
MTPPPDVRTERDPLGEFQVPASAYYGVQTMRAVENFPISGLRAPDSLVTATVLVKRAAAEANLALGRLDPATGKSILTAADEILGGALRDQFVVDVYQAGAGTSHNMNTNEVLANRAEELLGGQRGEYRLVHPNDHVNMGQSTNDVFPTATRLALLLDHARLVQAARDLAASLNARAEAFAGVLKVGRTHLQDAVPMTLGQEFRAYGVTIGEDIDRVREAAVLLREINMGATAIGTGINTDPRYASLVRRRLCDITGLALTTSPDLVEATQDTGAFVMVSGVLKRTAVKLSKICNDLRLLSSGPRAGLGEINLPPMQPGSSIMPGKVNPVIPEVVNQVCFQVIGNDLTVTMAAEGGQLQLNVFEPVIAANLFQSVGMLIQACIILRDRCIIGITANRDRIRDLLERSIGIVTALVPIIGYERATAVASEAQKTGRGVYELVLEKEWLTRAELDEVLSPDTMTKPRTLTQRPAG